MNLPFLSRNKEPQQRFYLFAGMGGSAAKRKHRRILWWSIAAGILVSAGLAAAMYFLNRAGK